MDIQELRRLNLAAWVESHSVPTKERSLFSQLKAGTASFGEKVARRLEEDYGMARGALDRAVEVREQESSVIDELAELVVLFGQSDRTGRNYILDTARSAATLGQRSRLAKPGNQ